MANLHRPFRFPIYWGVGGKAFDASLVIGIKYEFDTALRIETTWGESNVKDSFPELEVEELDEVTEWVDEHYGSSLFEDISNTHKEFLKLKFYREIQTIIQEALNAPVKATKEVLEGLPRDAEILVGNGSFLTKARFNTRYGCWGFSGNWLDDYARRNDPCLIKAGDAKTLEYLLQFTMEGVKR